MDWKLLATVFLTYQVLNFHCIKCEQVIVSTKVGVIRGTAKSNVSDNRVFTFYNIPYAKPPVGSLRFAKPEPFGNWSGILDATSPGNQCMQPVDSALLYQKFNNSEDCLQLNVYVPRNISESNRRSVMVWIHGGGFQTDTALTYDGSHLAVLGDVIVVTINYRLGIFGFLSVNDPAAKGNYGIWDQILALKWVNQNIESFGGNPRSVTIFGESAGAISVSLLSLIPKNKGLFQRVITQSGSANANAFGNTEKETRAVGQGLGCDRSLSKLEFITCMRGKDAKDIINNYLLYVYSDPSSIKQDPYFTPCLDGELFNESPKDIIKNKNSDEYNFFQSMDLMSGSCRNEGSIVLPLYGGVVQKKYNFNLTLGMTNDFVCNHVIPAVADSFFNASKAISNVLCTEYGVKNNLAEQGRQLLKLMGDLHFVAPIMASLQAHSFDNIKSKTYQYVFMKVSPSPFIQGPDWYDEPGHGDELYYLFPEGSPIIRTVTDEDRKLMKAMMTYWSNFAKYGDPNAPSLPEWPVFDNQKRAYAILDSNITLALQFEEKRMKIWLTDIPSIVQNYLPEHLTIDTKLGKVTGVVHQLGNQSNERVIVFYNIPYAKPPLGNLRFSKPERYGNWSGVRNGTTPGNRCIQPTESQTGFSEDCLQLNIYVPGSISSKSKRSVMVWIHGGAYLLGSALDYDGKRLALNGDVIIVTINYRLGIFGFLSVNDPAAKGNFAIYDQILALEWINENIESYGGDPTSVTIFGESAGGGCVSLLSLIPTKKRLFQRVIVQSGVINSVIMFGDSKPETLAIGEMSGCSPKLSSDDFVNCMRNKDAQLLVYNVYAYYLSSTSGTFIYFKPTIDGELFKENPVNLLTDVMSDEYLFFSSFDVMIGTCKTEGTVFLDLFGDEVQTNYNFNISEGVSYDYLCKSYMPLLTSVYFHNKSVIAEEICKEYGSPYNQTKQGQEALRLFTDAFYIAPSVQMLQSHSYDNVKSKTFQYLFSRENTYSYSQQAPDWVEGPGHADELSYVFLPDETFNVMQKQDIQLSKKIMSYWTNFAKYGDPNDPSLPSWPTYDNQRQAYINLDINITSAMKLEEKRTTFWLKDIPKLKPAIPSLDFVTMETKLGIIKGIRTRFGRGINDEINIFHNIPYAKPPLGALRFEKPQEYGKWEGILDATKPGNQCIQLAFSSVNTSEDCLQLNIYVPRKISVTSKLSVMVWIHGGGYNTGSAVLYDGTRLAMEADVIVVTINYRLGVFGFFSLNDPIAKGNYGLWDQILALEWVQNNIESYGGDPNSVTIFGESAGGFSVSLLSLIPRNKGLFHRVIAQSGVANSIYAIGDSEPESKIVGKLSGCSEQLSKSDFVSCMRNKDVQVLVRSHLQHVTSNPMLLVSTLAFKPTVDGELFSYYPYNFLVKEKSAEHDFFASIDFMTGTCKQEGTLQIMNFGEKIQEKYNFNISEGIPTDFVCNAYLPDLVETFYNNSSLISDTLCAKYTAQADIREQGRKLCDLYTDMFFLSPAVASLRSHSENNVMSKTFHYEFVRANARKEFNLFPYPPWLSGPGHADELVYFFLPYITEPEIEVSDDVKLANTLMTYWGNFARHGDPNGKYLPFWPVFDISSEIYNELDLNISSKMKLEQNRTKLWLEKIPEMLQGKPVSYNVTIDTKLGKIKGTRTLYHNKEKITLFYNIPYAKPPTGILRFAKPQEYGKWENTLDSTEPGPYCMQPADNSVKVSEDCLQLNVYIPGHFTTSAKKSVMVWIHGGRYVMGSALEYNGENIARKGDIIVVTINYRLGVFGFFSLNDVTAKGNYGLWDQIMALEWVHNNIESYGGDPTSVTIFGESAGGWSVSFLSLIPRNKGLFHRVIAQSGVANPFIAFGDSMPESITVGELTGCSRQLTNSQFVSCMRNKDARVLLGSFTQYMYSNPFQITPQSKFSPTIDGELFKKQPHSALTDIGSDEHNFFKSLDFMTGTCKNEGTLAMLFFTEAMQKKYNFNISVGIPTYFFCNSYIPDLVTNYFNNNSRIADEICREYSVENNPSEQGKELLKLFTDLYFLYPSVSSLRLHSNDNIGAKTFQYAFMYEGQNNVMGLQYPYWMEGPGHADDLIYLFEYLPLTSKEEIHLSNTMISYWANFAKTGDPNGKSLPFWPVYDIATEGYIELNLNISSEKKIEDKRIKFWSEEIPKMTKATPNSDNITIDTKLGKIKGVRTRFEGEKEVTVFYNIPYAKPPTGILRFAKPQEYGKWENTLDSTEPGPYCMQPADNSVKVSEDCLQLNVYIPGHFTTSAKKSVMVWIHGGGYVMGSALEYNGENITRKGDIIVVTINYRLGVFGFFSLNDVTAKGNYGLWDQIMALEWVHNNIESYGGDPTSVTIFGESAGGWSVSLLSLIPRNKGLFHRVIAQSGVANSFIAFGDSMPESITVGELTGCSRQLTNSQFVSCMRNKDARVLLGSFTQYMYSNPFQITPLSTFSPTIDGELFKKQPHSALTDIGSDEHNFFKSLDFMTGTCKNEGTLAMLFFTEAMQKKYNFNISVGIPSYFFCNSYIPDLVTNYFNNNSRIADEICREYSVVNNPSEQGKELLKLLTDLYFLYPSVSSLRLHSNDNIGAKTFQYAFMYEGQNNVMGLQYPYWMEGPGHADDLIYLFEYLPLTSKEEIHLSNTMISYWANFAKTGDPNGKSLPFWPVYDIATEGYIELNLNISSEKKIEDKRIKFWSEEIPKMAKATPKSDDVTIDTKLGKIKGVRTQFGSKQEVTVFYNIPYAKPPVGNLRFVKPQEYGKWDNTLDATKPGNYCMQPADEFVSVSEDCLQLNIYTPQHSTMADKKSVMVWIHGGGYNFGSGLRYNGETLAMQGDVIVVTINYRLGIFGFLSLNDSTAKGNYGLWDQIMALEWVHNNIESYGGDPNSVTIFGESAGGWSVSLQSLIPRNKGLFQRVIAQSGVSNSILAFGDSEPESVAVGEMSGCNRQFSNYEFVTCMRTKDAKLLSSFSLQYLYSNPLELTFKINFKPTIDGELFKDFPNKILLSVGSEAYTFFSSLDFMSGTCKNEGTLQLELLGDLVQRKFNFNLTEGIPTDFICNAFLPSLVTTYFKNNSLIEDAICKEYTVADNSIQQGKELFKLFSDMYFISPAVASLKAHSKQNMRSKTFQFTFERSGIFRSSYFSIYPDWITGPGHGDELAYIFRPYQLSAEMINSDDVQLSNTMISYWTNFAKYGDPNDRLLPNWPTFNKLHEMYLNIDINITARIKLEEKRVKFWLEDVPKLLKSHQTSDIIVDSKLGKIIGISETIDLYHKVNVFYNLPYAKPPVGDLRFAKPVPFGSLSSPFDATKPGNQCMQDTSVTGSSTTIVMSEDCLQLNIYVPGTLQSANNKSVMVWIHGGGYISGSALIYDGRRLAIKGEIIVVTVNYRLGVFGFLSLKDPIAKGNVGLWDQIMALEWIKENIHSFGGDPNSVTIFGESAGGMSVSLLSLIPRNRNLFHRVIAQSGVSNTYFSFGDSQPASLAVGELVGCNRQLPTEDFMKCMRYKDANDILAKYLDFTDSNKANLGNVLFFMPVIDGELFLDDPHTILKDKNSEGYNFFLSLDFMTGTCKTEGSLLLYLFNSDIQTRYNFDISAGIPKEFFCNWYLPAVVTETYNNNQQISKAICDEYNVPGNVSEQTREILNFFTDLFFLYPAVGSLSAHSEDNVRSNTYQYVFSKRSILNSKGPKWYIGPGHGEEIVYILQPDLSQYGIILDDEDAKLSSQMMMYWTNFAKFGDPNGPTLPNWPVFDNQKQAYMVLDKSVSPGIRYEEFRMAFWRDEIPYVLNGKPVKSNTTCAIQNNDTNNTPRSSCSVYLCLIYVFIVLLLKGRLT